MVHVCFQWLLVTAIMQCDLQFMQLIFTYLLIAVGAGIALPVKEWALVSVSEIRMLVGTRNFSLFPQYLN